MNIKFDYTLNNSLYHLLKACYENPKNRELDKGIDMLIEYMQLNELDRDVDAIVELVMKECVKNERE